MATPRADLRRQRTSMLTGALFLVAWGTFGLFEGLNSGFSGGLYDPEYRVPEVRRGGLAAKSGFEAGDRVISIEGRAVEELGMESRWPRSLAPRIGESRRFVIERHGQRISLDVAFPAPSRAAVNNRIRAALVGLAFLGFGLWTFLTVQSDHARTFAHIGLAAGVGGALGLGPNLGSWNGVQGHVATAANVLVCLLLLQFFVTFPTPKPVSRSRVAAWLLYGAWACLLVFLSIELMVHPALYYTTGSVASPLTQAYVLLILAAVTHTLVKSSRAELWESGMHWISLGLLAVIVGTASELFLPLNLPAWGDALWLIALPLSMALAVRKQDRLRRTGAGARLRNSHVAY